MQPKRPGPSPNSTSACRTASAWQPKDASITQLRPRSGDRARYELLDTLLTIGGLVAAGEGAYVRNPLNRLPPNALILALTSLVDQRFATDVLALTAPGGR